MKSDKVKKASEISGRIQKASEMLESLRFPIPRLQPDLEEVRLPDFGPGLPYYLNGEAAFNALKKAVNELQIKAPEDHDVLIEAFGIEVINIQYLEPHTFLFTGLDQEGNNTSVVCHFSQLVAHVVFLPQKGPERIITGFSRYDKTGTQDSE